MFSSILKGLNLCPFCYFSLVVGSLVLLVADFASMRCKHNFAKVNYFVVVHCDVDPCSEPLKNKIWFVGTEDFCLPSVEKGRPFCFVVIGLISMARRPA